MKSVRNCFEVTIVLVIIMSGVYSQRAMISQWWQDRQKIALPVAVEYQEITKRVEGEVAPREEEKAVEEKKVVEVVATKAVEEKEVMEEEEVVAVIPVEKPVEQIFWGIYVISFNLA